MKKVLFILLIIITLSTYMIVEQKNNIDDGMIRFRIIPNSNSNDDQEIKEIIKEDLEKNFFYKFEKSKSEAETDVLIKENMSEINKIINKYNIEYNIKYGYNYFPNKTYNGKEYNEGNYKSLVIYLGKSKGNNWWCIMYPPLCLLDNNNQNNDNIEYKSYIKELTE